MLQVLSKFQNPFSVLFDDPDAILRLVFANAIGNEDEKKELSDLLVQIFSFYSCLIEFRFEWYFVQNQILFDSQPITTLTEFLNHPYFTKFGFPFAERKKKELVVPSLFVKVFVFVKNNFGIISINYPSFLFHSNPFLFLLNLLNVFRRKSHYNPNPI